MIIDAVIATTPEVSFECLSKLADDLKSREPDENKAIKRVYSAEILPIPYRDNEFALLAKLDVQNHIAKNFEGSRICERKKEETYLS